MLKISYSVFSICCFLFLSTYQASATVDQDSLPLQWTVQEAVSFALKNNPDISIARQRIAIATAAVRQAESAFFPQFDINSQYSQTNTPMYSFGNILNQGNFDNSINFNDPGRTDNLNLNANLYYQFYNGGRDEAGVRASEANISAARSELDTIHTQLSFAVVRAFFSILQAEEMLEARSSAVEAIASSLAVAQARYDIGDLLKANLLEIEVEKSKAGENLILARHNLELSKRGFRNLLGLKDGDTILQPTPACTLELPTGNISFDNHPQLQKIDAMILAAQEQIHSSEGGKLPTVNGFLTYQLDQGIENSGSGNSWIAGVKANYSLFDGHRTSAQIAMAKARMSEILSIRKKTVLALHLEAERAALGLKQAEERLEVTSQMVSQAFEGAKLSRARFKEGVILPSDLISVENQLTEALVRRSIARTDSWIATADLRRAYGLMQF